MGIKFLEGPAMLIDDRILVVADLHIGMELEVGRSGITIPSQVEELKKRIDRLISETGADHLIFLGDIKHQVKIRKADLEPFEILGFTEITQSINHKHVMPFGKKNRLR